MENKQVTNPAAPNLTEPTGIHHEAQLEGEVQPGAETTRTLMVMLEWKGDVTHEQQLEILRERMVGCLVDRHPVNLHDSSGSFDRQLEGLINKFSLETASATPDFILASYLRSCLNNWNTHILERDKWWSKTAQPTGLEPGRDPQ